MCSTPFGEAGAPTGIELASSPGAGGDGSHALRATLLLLLLSVITRKSNYNRLVKHFRVVLLMRRALSSGVRGDSFGF